MQTSVQDFYKTVLEKRAAEETDKQWGASSDGQAVANAEVAANKGDQRAQLGDLLTAAPAAQKAETKNIGKLLPIAKKTEGTVSSNPMLKVAMHRGFFNALRETGLMKTADPDYIRTAYRAFEDEVAQLSR